MPSSNLPPIWRFDFGDYLSLGSVFQKFLSNLNLFTLSMYNLMNGGIGFANMQRTVYNTTVKGASTTPLIFVNPLAVAPSGLNLVQVTLLGNTNVAISGAVSVANWFFDGKNINVLNVAGLTPGSTYQISLEVM